jgi:hypothetical protein
MKIANGKVIPIPNTRKFDEIVEISKIEDVCYI